MVYIFPSCLPYLYSVTSDGSFNQPVFPLPFFPLLLYTLFRLDTARCSEAFEGPQSSRIILSTYLCPNPARLPQPFHTWHTSSHKAPWWNGSSRAAGPADQDQQQPLLLHRALQRKLWCFTQLKSAGWRKKKKKNTITWQKHCWEQTQNRNQLALFHCRLSFLNTCKNSTEPCVITPPANYRFLTWVGCRFQL